MIVPTLTPIITSKTTETKKTKENYEYELLDYHPFASSKISNDHHLIKTNVQINENVNVLSPTAKTTTSTTTLSSSTTIIDYSTTELLSKSSVIIMDDDDNHNNHTTSNHCIYFR